MKEGSLEAVFVPSQRPLRKAWQGQSTPLSGQSVDRGLAVRVCKSEFNPQVPVRAGYIPAYTHAHNLSSHKRIPGSY